MPALALAQALALALAPFTIRAVPDWVMAICPALQRAQVTWAGRICPAVKRLAAHWVVATRLSVAMGPAGAEVTARRRVDTTAVTMAVITAVTMAAALEEIVIVTNTITMASMGTLTAAPLPATIIGTTILRAPGAMFGGARTDIALMMRAPTLTSAVMDIGIGVDLRTDTRVQKIDVWRPALRLE